MSAEKRLQRILNRANKGTGNTTEDTDSRSEIQEALTASGKSKLLYKTGDDVIQMTGIKETKNGEHVISYTHLGGVLAGKGGSIKGLSRDDALKKFYAKYRSVMPNPKKFSKDY